MDNVAYERCKETKRDDYGLFAHGERRHDAYSLPDEDSHVFCPECGALAESFDLIDHKSWCFYQGTSFHPGSL